MVKRRGRFDPLPLEDASLQCGLKLIEEEAVSPLTIRNRQSWNGNAETISVQNGTENGAANHPESQKVVFSVDRPMNGTARNDLAAVDQCLDRNSLRSNSSNPDLVCGLGRYCSPRWMQRLASKQMFLALFCLTCVLQGMYYTYFASVVTTIEKLFQIQSKTTGIIMSATEMGQIGGSLLLTYYGGQGHRPKWIAGGMVLFGTASFVCSLPHFIFWQTKPNIGSNLAVSKQNSNTTFSKEMDLVCKYVDQNPQEFSNISHSTSTLADLALMNESMDHCESGIEQESVSRTTTVLAIFFVSLLGIGMGQTAVYTLGIPFIDDNVANKESPTYFAITIGVRILGPVFGFILGSLCISFYVDPFVEPEVTPKNARWIGAWWLGMFVVSVPIFLSSIAMFAFPRKLPGKQERLATVKAIPAENLPKKIEISENGCYSPKEFSQQKRPSLKDFPKTVRRLLKNDILLFRTASSALHILPIAGLYTFLPKYLESQFRLAAHVANMISGIGGILVMGVGIFASGVFIRKMKPSPKFVAGWLALTALLYSLGMALLMFMGCPINDFVGLIETDNGKELIMTCNLTCECNVKTFAPVCTSQGETYFSACRAGCSNLTQSEDESEESIYSNCECLGQNVTAEPGYCPLNCTNFIWYIVLFSVFVLIHSTNEVGSMLLTLRCVDPKDKAMAMGLIQFAIGLFANVPCPIIYGAVVDSACLVWEENCGKRGACWMYDTDVFRKFFHGTTGGIMLIAFFVDLVVWYKADKITFAEEETSAATAEELQPMQVAVQYESTL